MPNVIFCTCPDEVSAKNIAAQLVNKHLAACVSMIPKVVSLFHWENKIEEASEFLLMIKTTDENYAAVEALIKLQHPYKTPEIIALPIVKGSQDYLVWMSNVTNSPRGKP